MTTQKQSVNRLAHNLVKRLCDHADEFGVFVKKTPSGATLIDAGIETRGGYGAGQTITEICLGGLGKADITYKRYGDLELPSIFVYSDYPAISALGSQFAGWQIKSGKYVAMGSGPARALSLKPKELYEKISYKDISDVAVLVLETSAEPPEEAVAKISEECKVNPENLFLVLVPTSSVAGSVQISGRIVETGLHKLTELGFDPKLVTHACGYAPVAPVHPKLAQAMGRTNDAVIYCGTAYYTVSCDDDEELKRLLKKAPASASKSYGKPFTEIFKEADYDFYKIDPGLFAPAVFMVNNSKTGKTFRAGKIDVEVFKKSIKLQA
ncbi:MAG TPA: methenyltetrahydromethanopterin cyclohydrolase [Candidatus Bathyarchaeota archaeon]|nr:methenyltetrahydromethanopterin cyclohydrolase [Candidatus Bathyarchaeota archaeon]